ncbi:hypothetical protein [Agromyces subbeticus]|uniref:hypothetical protein n=1 Tax=Agromyces subbeticus TaxID=293890 RepID=UPI0003B33536|nr:hypothetical protein [Agromyces subbeticus]
MTIYITSVRNAATRLAEARARSVTLARATADAIARARTYTDADLSPQGLASKRAEFESQFRAAASTDLAAIQAEMTQARQYLADATREHTQIPNDAAALIRAEQKWRQIERILDAGGDLRKQIRTADADTALAIAEHAPSWLEAASTTRGTGLYDAVANAFGATDETPVNGVRRAAYARLADVSSDPALSELLRAEIAADSLQATAEPWLYAAGRLVEEGAADMLGAAVASEAASQADPAQTLEHAGDPA